MKKNDHWVPYVNLSKQFREEKKLLLPRIEKVLSSGMYVLSDEVSNLKVRFVSIIVKFCISVNSGTDALILSLMSLGIKAGDEVITQANSYIGSAAAIHAVGANQFFVMCMTIRQ